MTPYEISQIENIERNIKDLKRTPDPEHRTNIYLQIMDQANELRELTYVESFNLMAEYYKEVQGNG